MARLAGLTLHQEEAIMEEVSGQLLKTLSCHLHRGSNLLSHSSDSCFCRSRDQGYEREI
jgi:hypothetical protein